MRRSSSLALSLLALAVGLGVATSGSAATSAPQIAVLDANGNAFGSGAVLIGPVAVDATSPPLSVRVVNTGDAPLHFIRPIVAGEGFTTSPKLLRTIDPGQYQTVAIRCRGLSSKAGTTYSGTVSFASSDGGRATLSAKCRVLAAPSQGPTLVFRDGNGDPIPANGVTLGPVAVGAKSRWVQIRLANIGQARAEFNSYAEDSPGFEVSPRAQMEISPGSHRTVRIRCEGLSSKAGTTYTGTIRFPSRNAGVPTLRVRCKVRLGPRIALRTEDGDPLPAGGISLGPVAVGAESAPVTVQVVNIGEAPLHFTRSRTADSGFLSGDPSATLQPGASATTGVRCKGLAHRAGTTYSGRVTFYSDGGNAILNASCTVLSGPRVALRTEDGDPLPAGGISLGPVAVGAESAPVTVQVVNIGEAPLHFTRSRTADSGFLSGDPSATLQPGAFTRIQVRCQGLAHRAGTTYSGRVTFYSDGGNAILSASCKVVAPRLELRDARGVSIPAEQVLALGPVAVGMDSAIVNIRVSNTGNARLDVRGAASTGFTVVGLPATVSPGSYRTVGIRCRGLSNEVGRVYTGTITFSSNDPKRPVIRLEVACKVRA